MVLTRNPVAANKSADNIPEELVIAESLNPASFTLARPSIITTMDITEYDNRLHNAMREVKKVESTISSYTPEDVSILDRVEYAMKLRNIEAKVEIVTDALDALILDPHKAGIDTTEPNQLKCGLVHLMKENEKGVKHEISKLLETEHRGSLLSPAEEQFLHQQRKQ